MKAIVEHPSLELQLIVGASTMLQRFGKAVDVIREDGFIPKRSLFYVVEGETLSTQAKSTGLGIIELATAFDDLKPDFVVTVADRFETMATAISATYLNIPLVHLQGGEVTGNIDDRVRHAITKLADIHFVATEESKSRVIRMGENSDVVFNFGDPAMDVLLNLDLVITNEAMKRYGGIGQPIDWEKPYVLIVQHPVTTSYGEGFKQVSCVLEAAKDLDGYQKIVLWPNIDAGSDDVSKGIRVFREQNMSDNFHYFRNFSPEDYAKVLANASCCIGNSSSFIRECAFLGTPSVIVGDRQSGREHGCNVVFARYAQQDVYEKAMSQLNHGKFARDPLFGQGCAGVHIANVLSRVVLDGSKKICY
jgi:UDP-hydrolysing UDP-N-acetyl-D-glucosamine 2-epimerase